MKVCLRKGYHHAFDDLVAYPPSGVKYEIPSIVSSKNQSGFVNVLKRKSWRLYANALNMPNSIHVPCSPDANLIHANSGFLPTNRIPWVVDLEHVASFVGFEANRLKSVKGKIESILASGYCRKIMPWTDAGRMSIIKALDSRKFSDKIEVVYPAMHPTNVNRKKHDGTNLLFVAYDFFVKGGREAVQAFEMLRRKYDVNLTVISNYPKQYQKKYTNTKFIQAGLPRKTIVEKYFAETDVFILPSYSDTFGMLLLEAMNAGVPSVSTNTFAIPEMIRGSGLCIDASNHSWYGKDYLFVSNSWKKFVNKTKNLEKPDVVKSLVFSVSKLIEDGRLRKKLGSNGRREIVSGRFSIKNRNKKLKRIYEEALRY